MKTSKKVHKRNETKYTNKEEEKHIIPCIRCGTYGRRFRKNQRSTEPVIHRICKY
ncbi:MAG: hypothetical protein IPQ18_14645 [Saprospiraceae bacterium]|nr:hypothetical protein [Saprospiraceae bacterium]